MRYLVLVTTLTLAGCGDNMRPPTLICDARDVQSGVCTKSHYVCT